MPYKDRETQLAAQRAHYEKNKELFTQRTRDRRTRSLRYLKEYKTKNNRCTDCGERFPYYVLAFDHVPGRGEKIKNLCELARDASLETVKEEIKKCDIVCHNCHAERTHRRYHKAQ